MTLIRRPSPFGDLLTLRRAVDHLFDETVFRPFTTDAGDVRSMPLDIFSTADTLVIEAALPGVKPEDVDISVLGDRLTLTAASATGRTDEQGDYTYREVRRGRSTRSVKLPAGLRTDEAVASFENGILRLSIPRAEQARPRQIPISGTTEGTAVLVTATETTETAGTTEQPTAAATGAEA